MQFLLNRETGFVEIKYLAIDSLKKSLTDWYEIFPGEWH
jgi:hypothetical protein